MSDLEIFKNSINQIFSCLDSLDTNINDEENTNYINQLREYQELCIIFAGMINDSAQNEVSN